MPSLYDQDAGRGVPFGQNARKTAPSTHFGTRQVRRWTIYTTADTATDFTEPNSLYSQIVRALQQNVELYAVFAPATSFFYSCGPGGWEYAFQIDVAYDTSNDVWNQVNSFVSDSLDPSEWYYGYPAHSSGMYNPNGSLGLIDVVQQVLINAEVNDSCWVQATATAGDMTWPIDGYPDNDAPPGAVNNPNSELVA